MIIGVGLDLGGLWGDGIGGVAGGGHFGGVGEIRRSNPTARWAVGRPVLKLVSSFVFAAQKRKRISPAPLSKKPLLSAKAREFFVDAMLENGERIHYT